MVLRELLNPRQWKPPEDRSFFLDAEQIAALCDDAERAFQAEPSVLRLRGAPVSAPQPAVAATGRVFGPSDSPVVPDTIVEVSRAG